MTTTYTVNVSREDGLWTAIVTGLPPNMFGGFDFEHFADLHDGVEEALVDLVGHHDFELEWVYSSNELDYTKPLEEALTLGSHLESIRVKLDTARKDAISEMQAAGLSYRDIADALGMSHQRVAQLNTGRSPHTGRWEILVKAGNHDGAVTYRLRASNGRIVLGSGAGAGFTAIHAAQTAGGPVQMSRILDALGACEDPRPTVPIEEVDR